jgi:hypothetical protein
LAPYADYNNNQIYDPQNGDYPYIFGDQACYSITNDIYAAHTETGGNPFGAELHTMTYAINNPNDTQIHNSIFLHAISLQIRVLYLMTIFILGYL